MSIAKAELMAIGKNFKLKDFLAMNLGIFLVALGIHVFKNPNRFASGGVSGLSLILSHIVGLPVGSLMLFLNVAILILGFFFLGKDASIKTVYGSVSVSAVLWLMEIVAPMPKPLTGERFLELVFSVFVPGFGSALVFYSGG
ncbi:MAG: YitT family protein, partial [Clostridiales bacterium]|nr:YitT family protein [Clostridiales bacterium]